MLSMDLLDTPEKVAAFELWCLNVRISSILSCHRITPSRLIELKRLIPKLLKLYATRDMSISANLHGYSHWIESLSDNGVPREYWCAVFETINGQLKHLFGNTNNKNSSLSVFERYMQLEFVELKLHVEGRPTGFPIPFVIPSNQYRTTQTSADNLYLPPPSCTVTGDGAEAFWQISQASSNYRKLKGGSFIQV
jgi:hypothetical protein